MTTAIPALNRPPFKRFLRLILVGLLLLPMGILGGAAVMNYSGYCIQEGRYLKDEERIRHAASSILQMYPRITYAYDKLPKAGYEVIMDKSRCCDQGDMSRHDQSLGGTAIDPETLVLYKNVDEFLLVNPDCCHFARNGLYGELTDAGLWARLSGYSAGFVSAKFRVRYREPNGTVHTKFSGASWSYSTCGVPSVRLLEN